MTAYERSYRQYEIWCTKKEISNVNEFDNVKSFIEDCRQGYPNNNPKGASTLNNKLKGIIKVMKTKGTLSEDFRFIVE